MYLNRSSGSYKGFFIIWMVAMYIIGAASEESLHTLIFTATGFITFLIGYFLLGASYDAEAEINELRRLTELMEEMNRKLPV